MQTLKQRIASAKKGRRTGMKMLAARFVSNELKRIQKPREQKDADIPKEAR